MMIFIEGGLEDTADKKDEQKDTTTTDAKPRDGVRHLLTSAINEYTK